MLDLIIIGAGHAGPAASQVAAASGLEHVVLERGAVGESWRSQRWDSFTLNTQNAMNPLPGSSYQGAEPEGFEHRDAWVARLERYALEHALPVRARTAVTSVEQDDDAFVVTTEGERFKTRLATGIPVRWLESRCCTAAARTLGPAAPRGRMPRLSE